MMSHQLFHPHSLLHYNSIASHHQKFYLEKSMECHSLHTCLADQGSLNCHLQYKLILQAHCILVQPSFHLDEDETIVLTLLVSLQIQSIFLLRVSEIHVDHHLRSEEHTSELQSRFDLVCRLAPALHSFPTRRSSDLLFGRSRLFELSSSI